MSESLEIDEADRALIELLTENGRISNREIGGRVGLTEVTVAARLRRLRDSGIFRVAGVVDWEAAGYSFGLTFWISVEGRDPMAVASEIASHNAVHVVGVTFGAVDIIVYALATSLGDIDSLTRRFHSIVGVARLIVDVQYEPVKDSHRYALLRQDHELTLPQPVYELDDLDRGIMKELLNDGRTSNRMLARQFGSSEGTVRARLRRLENAKLLRIRGQIDPVLASELRCLAFVALELDGAQDDQVIAKLLSLPSVLSATRTTGPSQLLITLGAPNRMALASSVNRDIREIPGVRSTQTWEILRFVKMLSHFARFL